MLAIWSDIGRQHETDYLHWLTREHASERVSTPGFVAVRVFRSGHADICRYLICYDLESSDVVSSPAYLTKLNSPTPWSKRIMPMLQGFRRGGGPIRARSGVGQGGIVAPVIFPAEYPAGIQETVANLAQQDELTLVSLLEVDQDRTAVKTSEKSMRANDQSFAALLLLEGLTDASVRSAIDKIPLLTARASLECDEEIPYRQVFSLHRDML
jgi:hypothetical protein